MPAPHIIPRVCGLKVWAAATAVWRREGEPVGPPVTSPALGTGKQSYGRDTLPYTRGGCNELSLITAFLSTHVWDCRHPHLLDRHPGEPSPGLGSAESVTGLISRRHATSSTYCQVFASSPKCPTKPRMARPTAIHGSQGGDGNISCTSAPARDRRADLGAFRGAVRKCNSVRIKEMEVSSNWLRKLCVSLRQPSIGIQTK